PWKKARADRHPRRRQPGTQWSQPRTESRRSAARFSLRNSHLPNSDVIGTDGAIVQGYGVSAQSALQPQHPFAKSRFFMFKLRLGHHRVPRPAVAPAIRVLKKLSMAEPMAAAVLVRQVSE